MGINGCLRILSPPFLNLKRFKFCFYFVIAYSHPFVNQKFCFEKAEKKKPFDEKRIKDPCA